MITLRKESKNDYAGITKVNDRSFGRKAEGKLVEALRKTEEFVPELSIVAEEDKQIVGHILFLPVAILSSENVFQTLTLAPMSVLPEYQQKSIGKLLVIYGLQVARDLGYESAIVLGHPSYYPKFGFLKASKWDIKSPFPAPDEAFMAIELVNGSLENVNGNVVFPEEFNGL